MNEYNRALVSAVAELYGFSWTILPLPAAPAASEGASALAAGGGERKGGGPTSATAPAEVPAAAPAAAAPAAALAATPAATPAVASGALPSAAPAVPPACCATSSPTPLRAAVHASTHRGMVLNRTSATALPAASLATVCNVVECGRRQRGPASAGTHVVFAPPAGGG